MKKLSLILTMLLSFIIWMPAATDKDATSKIKKVNVYLNRAQVNRTARVSIGAGVTNISLTGLTTNLDQNSIQVRGKGNFVIMGVNYKTDYLNKNSASEKAKIIQKQIDDLNIENRSLDQKKQVLIEEKELLLQNRSIGGQQNGVTALELQKVSEYFRTRRNEIDALYLNHDLKKQENQKKLNDLRAELNEINRNANKPSGMIEVAVSAKTSQTITLDFDYIVFNAGWVPKYDIRANDGKDKVQLSYKASIYQNTGIDWDKVDLSISTGNPAQGGTKPSLSPWYLRILQQNYQTRSASRSYAAKPAMKKMEVAAEPAMAEDEFAGGGLDDQAPIANTIAQYTNVSESNLATTFEIALKQNVPSDNKEHTVDVQQMDVDASFNHAAVPKLDKDAFLLAQLTGWEQYNLLSGNANVYYDGAYVGNTYVDMNNTTDSLPVSLGRDQKVVITREKIKDYCKTRTFGGNVKKNIGYEITVRNTKNKDIKITLEDQYPISTNSEISVDLTEKSGAKVDETKGFLTWELELKPGETKTIQLKFEVKYPKKMRISNL